jgi:hypothetical protein
MTFSLLLAGVAAGGEVIEHAQALALLRDHRASSFDLLQLNAFRYAGKPVSAPTHRGRVSCV